MDVQDHVHKNIGATQTAALSETANELKPRKKLGSGSDGELRFGLALEVMLLEVVR